MSTKKWRQALMDTDVCEWYSGYIPAMIRARGEDLIPDTFSFSHIIRPGIFLQRYCDVLMESNYEPCLENNVLISRGTIAGWGQIYHEEGTLAPVLMVWDKKQNPRLPTRPEDMYMRMLGPLADMMSEKYEIPLRYRPLNDGELWDPKMKRWRKVVQSGSFASGNVAGFAVGVMLVKISDLMERVMRSPADKFSDKTLKEARTRNWSFEEAGIFDREKKGVREMEMELMNVYLDMLKKQFGIETEPGDITDVEKRYVEEFKKMFYSKDYVFASSAEKRFEKIPSGTSLGKNFIKISGGPLIRTYILREGDTIRDMMFTGTLHMYPPEGLEELANNLKGCKIDDDVIRTKVSEMFAKGMEIGLMDAETLSSTIMQACKDSYSR